VLKIPGAKEIMLAFFCYCAIEQMVGLWASSYLVMKDGISAERAAGFASLFYIGITAGRAVSGFLTYRLDDKQMIRLGQAVMAIGIVVMLLPLGEKVSLVGLVLIGLGCAPIYPSVIHSTPDHFGEENSQSIIGVQMASANLGSLCAPPVFGLIANHISASLLPVYFAALLTVMVIMCERLNRKCHE
jgi:fucose permease